MFYASNMTFLRQLIVCSVLVLLYPRYTCCITSSIYKIRQLVLAEEDLTATIKAHCDTLQQHLLTIQREPKTSVYEVNYQQSRLEWLQDIYKNMVLRVAGQSTEERLNDIYHPSSAVYTIKFYVTKFNQPLSKILSFKDMTKIKATNYLPEVKDLNEAYQSLVRLQAVYNFSTVDLYHGRVMNRSGHNFTVYDAVQIGSLVPDEHLEIGVTWINIALTESNDNTILEFDLYVAASALFFRAKQYTDGVKYLEMVARIDPFDQKVLDLLKKRNEYVNEEIILHEDPIGWEYSQSCTQPTMVLDHQWYHVCRYKQYFLPYVLYKEEILHWHPYISVFYDVVNDETTAALKNHSETQLTKSLTVGSGTGGVYGRTSSNTFLDDVVDPLLQLLSQKIGEVTHLNTQQNLEGTSSAEPYQVVNYGIGGEYRPHVDASPGLYTNAPSHLHNAGDRIATFLIYLSDVEYGGATVFPNLRIKMPPIKVNMSRQITIKKPSTDDPNRKTKLEIQKDILTKHR